MMKVAMIGFGTVGSNFVKVLHVKRKMLKDRYGLECEIVAVSDINRGSVYDPKGLDIPELLRLVKEANKIDGYKGGKKGMDSLMTIRETNADVIVEVAWTNLETGEPGFTHIKEALRAKKHVITSNKGPLALAYPELKKLADENGVQIRFECTVMSGTPTILLGMEGLAGHKINGFRGILNGTNNYMRARDPLASVSGTMNALTFETDGLGPVTIIGKGAGGIETGHGILTDLLAIHRSM
ncbi:MAG: hypothetical protein ABSA11_15980 [Candidatus Bathyarchaeia archaeon]|jgi:homoserine dehydrogenase